MTPIIARAENRALTNPNVSPKLLARARSSGQTTNGMTAPAAQTPRVSVRTTTNTKVSRRLRRGRSGLLSMGGARADVDDSDVGVGEWSPGEVTVRPAGPATPDRALDQP